ncbi:MAG: MvaI/BcnI restriction endonuclease family protein [Candidatus Kapabacteria bacterium]|nr:MvaI/BcnI restriction endonuclease family protein [Candidatus Kapabacteria bacterium]
MKSKTLIIKKFQEVKSKGFIKSSRTGNTAIGKTFEDAMAIKENNDKLPDFGEFEVKSQRFLSSSKITLFTLKPTNPENANQILLQKYGYISGEQKLPSLHTSFTTKPNTLKGNYSLNLKIDKRAKKVFIQARNLHEKKEISECFYTFKDIELATKKLKNLFVVTADTKTKNQLEYFHYTNAKVFTGFNFQKFLLKLENDEIQYDIRMGYYKTGINLGKPHDHGSGFRINRDNLPELFDDYFEVS